MATLDYSRVIDAGPGWTRVELNDGTVVTVRGDRATRNNNPGNIEHGRHTRAFGALDDDGRFAVFPSREAGIRAQAGLIFDSPAYAGLTLSQAISRYAPEFENNTRAYASRVSQLSGVPLDTVMRDIPASQRQAVVEAMQQVEGNRPVKAYDAAGNLAYSINPASAGKLQTKGDAYGQLAGTMAPQGLGNLAGRRGEPPGLFAAPTPPVERGGPLAPAFTANIAPPGTMAAALAPAPAGVVGQGPSLAAPPTPPSPSRPDNLAAAGPVGLGGPGGMYVGAPPPNVTEMGRQYGALGQSLAQAGLQNLAGAPLAPQAPPAPAISPTIAPPAETQMAAPSAVINPIEAPPVETKSPQSRRSATGRDILGGAVRGALGGLPGAVLGAARAASRTQNPGPNQGGLFDSLFGANNAFAPVAPGDRFGFGSGLQSVLDAMTGPRGQTAFGSHPGSTITGLGPGIGYTLSSDKYGWTETYSPDGSFMGISFDGKKEDKDEGSGGGLGGFFSGLFD